MTWREKFWTFPGGFPWGHRSLCFPLFVLQLFLGASEVRQILPVVLSFTPIKTRVWSLWDFQQQRQKAVSLRQNIPASIWHYQWNLTTRTKALQRFKQALSAFKTFNSQLTGIWLQVWLSPVQTKPWILHAVRSVSSFAARHIYAFYKTQIWAGNKFSVLLIRKRKQEQDDLGLCSW